MGAGQKEGIMAEEFNLGEDVGITLISDQQKGLENAGHNSRSCKNNLVLKPTKEKGKRRRPRKVRQAQTQPGEAQSDLATQQSQV
ncbi:hypothetical protein AAHA92_00349 [Salvia divinorum]|uniref:Uncharacterized protein n=1 Tax=Salvia divinorum TaxID=28513 RepID=A0ABD1IJA3_SALDI